MDLSAALSFVRAHRNGVLVTQKRDGRPQLSNIIYAVGDGHRQGPAGAAREGGVGVARAAADRLDPGEELGHVDGG